MNVLAMDCSSEILSLTLKKGDSFFNLDRNEGLKHSENLMTGVDWLFQQAQIEKKELDLVAVSIGPGSFTGLRIALATAKAIARGCNSGLVGIPTLDLYGSAYSTFPGVVIPVLDARKSRYYCAVYKQGQLLSEYLDSTLDELKDQLKEEDPILFTGPHCAMLKKEFHKRAQFDPFPERGMAVILAQLGLEEFKNHGSAPDDLGPLYLRKSEAEIASGL